MDPPSNVFDDGDDDSASRAMNSLPLDDLELEEEEMEGFVVSSSSSKKDKRKRPYIYPSWQWACLLGLLTCIALALAIIAVLLYAHHVRVTHSNNSGSSVQAETTSAEGDGGIGGKTTTATTKTPETAATQTTIVATHTSIGGETNNKAAEIDFARGISWRPASFVVHTENPPSANVLQEYAKEWGTWQLELPTMDRTTFCHDYSHCDVPRDQFPSDAWQSDSTYVRAFLEEADALVDRAMHAILAEYGKSPDDTTMFDLTIRSDTKRDNRRELRGPLNNGGWTTERSMQGLARRLLHAIMTRDTFTFVMGGHSAAAGHGNHFKQSYTMQFHKMMEPVFSDLGVQLISRNLAQGGLGTVQSSLGAADVYGDEVDFMVWDSGMTEGRDVSAVDLFGRQALLAHRVPVLWNLNENFLKLYHEHCDADVGQYGSGGIGIPTTQDEKQAETLPYALRYMKCDAEHGNLCNANKFHANCWVERPDITPPTQQKDKPGSQVKWHPGFRWHQLTGRILAYTILSGLKEALAIWKKADGNLLPDDAWHVTAYYDNIRKKVANLDPSLGECPKYEGRIPARVCRTQMRGRGEFTPRANPEQTSIRSILKTNDYMPMVKGDILYDGPDVRNPMFDIPPGQVDVVAILNNGRTFPDEQRRHLESVVNGTSAERRVAAGDKIAPGKGYMLRGHPPGYCDGSYNAICGRQAENPCLLNGHHDSRGGLYFHEYSGWIIMELPRVTHGIIMIKMETWHWPEEVEIAQGWTTVNNERHLTASGGSLDNTTRPERGLKRQPVEFCNDFHFDFTVDGNLTSYNLEQYQNASKNIQRVVQVVTLLDDPTFVEDGEEKNVEVAVRMRGCGDQKVFSLTHVYWA